MKVRNQPKLRRVTRSPQVGGKNSNIENIRVKVNDILVHVGTVLENMKKGTSYNNKTYIKFKLTIYNLIYQTVRNIGHLKIGKQNSNIKNIRVKVNDIMVHVGTVLENMKKGTSYNNKTYIKFKLTIYNLLLEI